MGPIRIVIMGRIISSSYSSFFRTTTLLLLTSAPASMKFGKWTPTLLPALPASTRRTPRLLRSASWRKDAHLPTNCLFYREVLDRFELRFSGGRRNQVLPREPAQRLDEGPPVREVAQAQRHPGGPKISLRSEINFSKESIPLSKRRSSPNRNWSKQVMEK